MNSLVESWRHFLFGTDLYEDSTVGHHHATQGTPGSGNTPTGGLGGGIFNAGGYIHSRLHNRQQFHSLLIRRGYSPADRRGIYARPDSGVVLQSTIVALNDADDGKDSFGQFSSADYNLIQNGIGWTWAEQSETAHNIIGQNPLLGPLVTNGGPTPTYALSGACPTLDSGANLVEFPIRTAQFQLDGYPDYAIFNTRTRQTAI